MKLPRRIADILKSKQEYIDSQRAGLQTKIVRLQDKLLNDILAEIVPNLDVKDGIIQETANNYRLMSILDKTYKNFQNYSAGIVLSEVVKTTTKISKLSNDYFKIVLSGDLPQRFDKIVESTNKLINLRIGLDGGKPVAGGFMKSLLETNSVGTDIKQITSKAITSNIDRKEYVQMLKDKITGIKEGGGSLDRQFQRYAYDLYQQYDAAYNKNLGDEFGFNYFIYQGGLVKDSREFCVEHNNNVYSVEEAQTWVDWVSPTTGEHPSYMDYPGYDPLIDRGGYNCRHAIGWISDELAFEMRPDLKNVS